MSDTTGQCWQLATSPPTLTALQIFQVFALLIYLTNTAKAIEHCKTSYYCAYIIVSLAPCDIWSNWPASHFLAYPDCLADLVQCFYLDSNWSCLITQIYLTNPARAIEDCKASYYCAYIIVSLAPCPIWHNWPGLTVLQIFPSVSLSGCDRPCCITIAYLVNSLKINEHCNVSYCWGDIMSRWLSVCLRQCVD
jgi:hypothetical protein